MNGGDCNYYTCLCNNGPATFVAPHSSRRSQTASAVGPREHKSCNSKICVLHSDKRKKGRVTVLLKKKDVSGCECSLAALGICVFLYIHLSEPDLAVSF